ncbi:hypothetical protein MNBD_GAMMA09-948 [hydrothermal vent metagenome]|uniref:Uncharacterized protein n=1 Tax=hydrothermal vent metagenome TaxID=652676 RepID=A0A3B0XN47_9ZZZZ
MKFDGHVKLTAKAITRMKIKCPVTTGSCNAPMFKDDFRLWFGDSKQSTPTDNYTSAVFNYISNAITPDNISAVKLPDAVAFVDLNERWTHDDPKGQRYHFMRARGESNQAAYYNAINFIERHTFNWVSNARKILKFESAMYRNKDVKPLQRPGIRLNNYYVKELALALHSLQDSFSPAHTQRYTGQRRPTDQVVAGIIKSNSNVVMPIRNLYDYSAQDKNKHSSNDYSSGGPAGNWGELAVNASADLMILSIESLWKNDKGLTGWGAFKAKWLTARFN